MTLAVNKVRQLDFYLIAIMAVLAACGLIYEYLLSHYAGRVLGSMESAIYSMIGIMIVSMGFGSLFARRFVNEFQTFAWLEILVGLIGAGTILIIATLIGYAHYFPQLMAWQYELDPSLFYQNGITAVLVNISQWLPYVFGFILGALIGMEIPLIARIREQYYGQHLQHNAGTIYGADYIGAGVGAALWVWLMLKLDIHHAAAMTASLNLIAGIVFMLRFRGYLKQVKRLIAAHAMLAGVIVVVALYGGNWLQRMESMLYFDEVVYQHQTAHQNLVFTKHPVSKNGEAVLDFYINGAIQFSSMDEHVYHEMLVHPAMLTAARQQNILIIGGGDGLAAREALKWPVEQLTLVDFDSELNQLFKTPEQFMPEPLANRLSQITQNSLTDERVTVVAQDAFIYADDLLQQMLQQGRKFDVIIVDLPDPNHPDLNKVYSQLFYHKLHNLLAGDGALSVQSNSPYHAKDVFLTIGKTLHAAGFKGVAPYQQNVPSFGQWGFTLATPVANNPQAKIEQSPYQIPDAKWVTPKLVLAAFEFPKNYFDRLASLEVNSINNAYLYNLYQQAWSSQGGYTELLGE